MKQLKAPVISNAHLTGEYWLIEVDAPEIAVPLAPGQFVNIRCSGQTAPFLRRPFSVFRTDRNAGRLQVAYKVIGEGTQLMTGLRQADLCDLTGPFGKPFDLPSEARHIAVVGRGIGIAALPTLVDQAVGRGVAVSAFLSARTPDNLVGLDVFDALGCRVRTHCDGDSEVAMVTDHLIALAETESLDAIYVCGSNRLIRAAHALAVRRGIPAQSAMEQHMACGFGDCHGCVIAVNLDPGGAERGYREVCHHGPVFDTWEVVHAEA